MLFFLFRIGQEENLRKSIIDALTIQAYYIIPLVSIYLIPSVSFHSQTDSFLKVLSGSYFRRRGFSKCVSFFTSLHVHHNLVIMRCLGQKHKPCVC